MGRGYTHIRPPALRRGDTIAVVAPSGTPMSGFPGRAERAVRFLEAQGYRVKIMPHAKCDPAGPPGSATKARVSDFNAALRDPEVRMVLGAMGGWVSNGMLPLLDLKAIERDPKIIQGHSDVTALLVGIHAATGLVTFHGPQLIPHFGRPTGPNPDTFAWWRQLVTEPTAKEVPFPWPRRFEDPLTPWESRADRQGRRALHANPPPRVDNPRTVEGELLVGNLVTLQVLAGTEWWPDFGSTIFAWEEVREDFAGIERSLFHLRATGALDDMVGMVIGKPLDCSGRADETFEGIVRDALAGLDFPVAFDWDFGHREPFLAMPVGGRVRLGQDGSLTLLEAAVAKGRKAETVGPRAARARPRRRTSKARR